jgi:8-oxo-dGTP pyrophosphatase MutT (NUDIX family)
MARNKKSKVKILIKEFQGRGGVSDGGLPFGGFSPSGPVGTFQGNAGRSMQSHPLDRASFADEEDLTKEAKVVMYRNGHVLLLKKKNEEEWDLPGGHIKRGEGTTNGLQREVFEETGLSLAPVEFRNLNLRHDNIEFYYATFPRDDIQKSHEHSGYKFFPVEQALQIEDMLPHYKEAIKKTIEQSGAPYSHGEITESTGPGIVVRIK